MCLAVPGCVVQWLERETVFAEALVEFAGVRRRVNMACVPEADLGEYVLVHAGVAIARISQAEAARTLETLERLDLESADHDETGG